MVAIQLRPSIVLLGDSLTQFGFGQQGEVGWAQLLAQAYTRRADVLNRGFQGYNSRQFLQILPELLQQDSSTSANQNVLFWTLSMGSNDAALSSGREAIDLPEFQNNLHQIVSLLRQGTSCTEDTNINEEEQTCSNSNNTHHSKEETPIVLLTAPSCDVALWKQLDPDDSNIPDNGNAIYKDYRDATIEIAQHYSNCSVLDTWQLLGGEEKDPDSLTDKGYHTDGVHWTAKGNRIVLDGLMQLIRQEYPHLKPMTDGNGQFGPEGVPMEGKLWWLYDSNI